MPTVPHSSACLFRWRVALLAGIGLGLLLLSDGWPGLRGPAPDTPIWHWDYQPAPPARWGPALLSVAWLWLLGVWLWRRPPAGRGRTWLLLTALTAGHLVLQISLVYAHHADWPAELVNRTLANNSHGYFRLAAEVEDLSALLRAYPAAMPTFAAEHPRTHPPGLVILPWLTIQAWAHWPAGAEAMAAWVRPQRCADLWLLDRPPAVAAALGTWAILPGLVGALSIWPAYALARALGGDPSGARLAALMSVSLPALLLFLPQPDQLYPLLTLTLAWAMWRGLMGTGRWAWGLAGGLLSLNTLLSLGNAALGLLVAVCLALYPRRPGESWRGRLAAGLVFAAGAASLWLLYWAIWGVAPWAIAQTGLAQHAALVNSQRPYGVWLVYNLIDLVIFAGWPVIVANLAATFAIGRLRRRGLTPLQAWGAGVGLFGLALALSGGVRGEAGRLWLFAMPLLGVSAGLYLSRHLTWGLVAATLGVQLGLGVALGLSWRVIEPVIVVAQPPTPPAAHPHEAGVVVFDQGLRLTAAAWPAEPLPRGATWSLYLAWSGEGPTARPYTLFVHLLDPQGRLIAQADGWPADGQWPPSCWPAGEAVVEVRRLTLPPQAPAGVYQLALGWYDARDGQRLSVVSDAAPRHPAWAVAPDAAILRDLLVTP